MSNHTQRSKNIFRHSSGLVSRQLSCHQALCCSQWTEKKNEIGQAQPSRSSGWRDTYSEFVVVLRVISKLLVQSSALFVISLLQPVTLTVGGAMLISKKWLSCVQAVQYMKCTEFSNCVWRDFWLHRLIFSDYDFIELIIYRIKIEI